MGEGTHDYPLEPHPFILYSPLKSSLTNLLTGYFQSAKMVALMNYTLLFTMGLCLLVQVNSKLLITMCKTGINFLYCITQVRLNNRESLFLLHTTVLTKHLS